MNNSSQSNRVESTESICNEDCILGFMMDDESSLVVTTS